MLDGTGDSLLAAALLELSRICRVSSVTFEVSLRGMEIGSGWMTLALFGGSRTSSSLLSVDIRMLVEENRRCIDTTFKVPIKLWLTR